MKLALVLVVEPIIGQVIDERHRPDRPGTVVERAEKRAEGRNAAEEPHRGRVLRGRVSGAAATRGRLW
jgi:hypothetical protein